MIILPVLSPFMSSVYTLFEDIVYFFNSIELLKISIRNLRAYEIILYYFIYYLVLKYFENHGVSYFKLMVMLLVILLMDGFDYIIIYDQVIMLDVGQGDSILLKKSHNEGNILIDSYNNLDNLKSLGVKKKN